MTRARKQVAQLRGWHYIADDLDTLEDWYAAEADTLGRWFALWS